MHRVTYPTEEDSYRNRKFHEKRTHYLYISKHKYLMMIWATCWDLLRTVIFKVLISISLKINASFYLR